MKRRRRGIISVLIAIGILAALAEFLRIGWYPDDQRRIVPTVDG